MTECYRYAVDTYEQMTDEAKSKISLELLYNAICYYHGDAEGISRHQNIRRKGYGI